MSDELGQKQINRSNIRRTARWLVYLTVLGLIRGLMLFECLKLRVQDLNFDMKILTIHDGKGQKDRTLPMPDKLVAALHDQVKIVAQ